MNHNELLAHAGQQAETIKAQAAELARIKADHARMVLCNCAAVGAQLNPALAVGNGGGDPEKDWSEFWSDICAPAGKIDLAQIKRELSDFRMLIKGAARVYEHVTGGMITKPNTVASVVISVADEKQQERFEQWRNDDAEDFEIPRPGVPDHILREVVNSLRDIAVEFHAAHQLRERLRHALSPLLPPVGATVSGKAGV